MAGGCGALVGLLAEGSGYGRVTGSEAGHFHAALVSARSESAAGARRLASRKRVAAERSRDFKTLFAAKSHFGGERSGQRCSSSEVHSLDWCRGRVLVGRIAF